MEQQKPTIPISFLLRLAATILLNFSLFYFADFYGQQPLLRRMAHAANLFLTTSVLISLGKFIIVAFYNRRHASQKVRGNFVLGINRLATMLNIVFLVIALMIGFGINPKEFITSMTIVAMAIAVIFREYITNMISGLIVMFSDQFSIGDHVKIGDNSGKIIDITFANIVILNEEEDVVLVPNNLLFTVAVINKSAQFSNKITIKFELPIDQKVDAEVLKEKLIPQIKSSSDLLPDGEITVKVAELARDFVQYKMDLYALDASNKRQKKIESEVLDAVVKMF